MIEIVRGVAISAGLFGASMAWAAVVTPWLARRIGWSGQP